MADYIPPRDADLNAWLLNFGAQLDTDSGGGSAVAFCIPVGTANALVNSYEDFGTLLAAATNPITRTPVTVQAKDDWKALWIPQFRQAAQTMQACPDTTDDDRERYGITVPKSTRTPVPPPTSTPILGLRKSGVSEMTLGYTDTDNPDGKNKAAGAIGVEIWRGFTTDGSTVPTDQLTLALTATKSPFVMPIPLGNAGNTMTLQGRYVTRSGPGGVAQSGPWSAPLKLIAT